MKRIILVICTGALLLAGCAQIEGWFNRSENGDPNSGPEVFQAVFGSEDPSQGGTSIMTITVSPRRSNTVGKEGGTIVLTASIPEKTPDGKENTRVLSEFFSETVNFDAPYVQYKGREQVDSRTVRYTFVFEKNNTGKDREPVGAVLSDTLSSPIGFGWFTIRQTAQ